jgi:hypothetical protein
MTISRFTNVVKMDTDSLDIGTNPRDRGVVPDYTLEPSISAIASGEDVAMAMAMAMAMKLLSGWGLSGHHAPGIPRNYPFLWTAS